MPDVLPKPPQSLHHPHRCFGLRSWSYSPAKADGGRGGGAESSGIFLKVVDRPREKLLSHGEGISGNSFGSGKVETLPVPPVPGGDRPQTAIVSATNSQATPEKVGLETVSIQHGGGMEARSRMRRRGPSIKGPETQDDESVQDSTRRIPRRPAHNIAGRRGRGTRTEQGIPREVRKSTTRRRSEGNTAPLD